METLPVQFGLVANCYGTIFTGLNLFWSARELYRLRMGMESNHTGTAALVLGKQLFFRSRRNGRETRRIGRQAEAVTSVSAGLRKGQRAETVTWLVLAAGSLAGLAVSLWI